MITCYRRRSPSTWGVLNSVAYRESGCKTLVEGMGDSRSYLCFDGSVLSCSFVVVLRAFFLWRYVDDAVLLRRRYDRFRHQSLKWSFGLAFGLLVYLSFFVVAPS